MSNKLITLQSALDAFDLRDDAFLSVAVIKAKLSELPTVDQVHSTEVAFWKKRAEFYGETCSNLLREISKGGKICSIEVNEHGIIFTMEQEGE